MKILGSYWFSELGGKVIGIVVVDTGFEIKAYIGNGDGHDQSQDESRIARHGAKFPVDVAREMMGV